MGFNPELERQFLAGVLNPDLVLRRELETQLGEDVGLIQFHRDYDWDSQDRLVDRESGWVMAEMLVGEEGRWMEQIETILRRGENVVHLRPIREEGQVDCLDFWYRTDRKIKWVRVVVEDLGEDVALWPMETKMNLAQTLNLFELSRSRTDLTMDQIKQVTEEMLVRFLAEYGDRLYEDTELISRLYAAITAEADRLTGVGVVPRNWKADLDNRTRRYMRDRMVMAERQSFGCAGSTMVGTFRIEMQGGQMKIIKGALPEGNWKLCDKCGLYYQGDKCPICD